MGCDYPSSVLSSYQNELHSEIVTTRNYLLSKSKYSNKLNGLYQKRKILNLKSTQNIGKIDENLNIKNHLKKSFTLNNIIKRNELYYSEKIILRLPVEKFNKLFDDNINEYYNNTYNKKKIKKFSFNKNELYLSKRNNFISSLDSINLNSTKSTIESESCKNNSIRNSKKEI